MKKTIKLSIATTLLLSNLNAQYQLEDIIVTTATKTEQSIQDVTSNVNIITSEELEERHITTVLDALRLSGISLTQSGGLGQTSSFFMNGMSAEHTLVMIDGIRYNDPTVTNGYALLDQIMISDIEKIEIINGAQSGIWGADAAAGIINIITKKASNQLAFNANLEYGTYNTKKTKLSASQTVDKFSYYIGLNYLDTDGISAMTPNGENPNNYEDDKYKNKTVNLKLSYALTDQDTLKFNTTRIDAKGNYDDQFSNSLGNDILSKHETKNYFKNLSFEHRSDIQTLTLYKKDASFDRIVGSGIYIGNTEEYGVTSELKYNSNDFILFGLDRKEQILKSSYSTLNGSYKSKGFFITNSNKFNKLILTESIRKDNYNTFNNKTTGKIGLKYNIANDLDLNINYGSAYKTPSLYNLYAAFGTGNQNLQPEDIKSKDISLNYKNLKLTYFESTIDDEILYLYSSTLPDYYNSTKKSYYKGYKLSYLKNISEDTLLGFNYLNQTAKDKDGQDLQRRIQESANLSIDYYGIEKTHIGFYTNYVGKRYDDLAKTKSTGNYTLINSVVNYEMDKSKKIYIKIDNLTDKLYQEVDGYSTPGRTISVGINASF